MKFKIALLGVLSILSAPSYAQSGCSGQPNSGYVCGNGQATSGLPGFYSQSTLLDRGFGSGQGTVVNRGVSGWLATVAPSLGVNGGTGGSIILNGSTSGSATISVPAAAGTVTFQLPNTNGVNNQVLATDGSGHLSWASISGTGTVTSVALSMPAIFAVTGSPITASGTFGVTFNNQSANTVFAGPTTGAAATPAFRALVGADLPNPSASTLGGIQSYVGVSSQWIRSISTSGVPASSQPAFSDISGTLAPTQCPASGLATLGCVNAINATASQWLRSLSTAGAFTASQPTFADIAGAATLAQLPSISNNSVLGNNSGGTAVPSALSASNVLDMLGSTQGQLLYRGSGAWTVLSPGTSGQVLTTNGAAANPSWTTVSGTGTVTSVATNNGVTGGPITTTGTIGLDAIADGTLLANVSGVSQHPTATAPSAILDVIGSGTGSVLYRAAGGTGWQALAAGTNGQVLTMGASTPAWSNAGTVTNVTTAAGTGISVTGTCTVSTSGTCTVSTNGSVDANVLNTQTSNYTIATTDCGKTIQAGTGSTGLFTITLPAVGGFSTTCTVNVKNGDTARGKALSGFPSDLNSILWPKQALTVKIINGAWATTVNPGRWRIPGSTELCVRQDGSSTSDGLGNGTVAGDCLSSIQTAVTTIGTQWDGGGYSACSIGLYAGGTSIFSGSVSQTGQSIGCYLTYNIRGNVTWTGSGPCLSSGDNGIAIVNWNLGFVPTYKCNTSNSSGSGQFYCHQTCIYDFNGGTAVWIPGGVEGAGTGGNKGTNDSFFYVDLQGSATFNAQVNIGNSVDTYQPLTFMYCESHCSKITASGTVAFSALVTMGVGFVLRSGSVITTSLSWPGGSVTNPTTPTGNAVLITNGTSIPGGTSPAAGFPAQNSNFGLVCSTIC